MTPTPPQIARRDFLKGAAALGAAAGAGIAAAQQHTPPAQERPVDTTNPQTAPLTPSGNRMLHVAMLQMNADDNDQEKNGAKAVQFCRWAKERDPDIVLMPEMFNVGYRPFFSNDADSIKAWQDQAVAKDSEWVQQFAALARELDMAIGVTYLEKWPGAPRNTITLFDRHGNEAYTYAKMHTCDFAFEMATTPGEEFPVADVDTQAGNIKVGSMICFDREFPESARMLMLNGAELVLVPNACLLDELRLAQFQVRALENSMCVAMANYAAPFMDGHSIVCDVAGGRIALGDNPEAIVSGYIDIANMRDYRSRTIWGDAFRRPHRYGALTRDNGPAIFERKDAFGNDYDRTAR